MLPLLRDGDQVLVSHIRDQVQLGDIVVFQRGDTLIAHRVLRIWTVMPDAPCVQKATMCWSLTLRCLKGRLSVGYWQSGGMPS